METLNLAGRAGRWSAAHWKTAVFGWLALVAVAIVAGGAVGTKKQTDADAATGKTAKAMAILEDAGFKEPATEGVLVQSKTGTVASPVVADVVRRVSASPNVTNVMSPIRSKNGHATLVQFDIRGDHQTADMRVAPVLAAVAAAQHAHPSYYIGEFGMASANHALNDTLKKDMQRAEATSLPVTLIILFVAFGALVAAGVPVLLAFSGVLATTGLAQLVSHVVPAADATQSVILLIGMAVGVDYSLFYIRREREERARGLSHRDALLKTAATSGQAVLISGATVMIAMAGMFFSGSEVFTSIAVGSMLMVAVALIGSLSVLPAVMAKLGDRVNRGRLPFLGRRKPNAGDSRLWSAVLDRVVRRPALSAVLAIRALERKALATGEMKQPIQIRVNADGTVARVSIPLVGDGNDGRSQHALRTLRSDVIPQTIGAVPGTTVAVSGMTAGSTDFTNTMKSHVPLVFGFVLALVFLLMLVTFRSIVIPAKAVLLNLLSVGAAYGVMVAIFQNRVAEGLLG